MTDIGERKLTPQIIRRYEGNYLEALKRDGFRCVSDNNVVVHHKDHNRQHNSLHNLISLCRHCHAGAHGMIVKLGRPRPDIICELRQNGMTYQVIAAYLGISRQRVHQIIAGNPCDHYTLQDSTYRKHWELVAELKTHYLPREKRYEYGTISMLARKYGVSRDTVSRIGKELRSA